MNPNDGLLWNSDFALTKSRDSGNMCLQRSEYWTSVCYNGKNYAKLDIVLEIFEGRISRS